MRRLRSPAPASAAIWMATLALATGCPSAWKLEAVNGAPPTINKQTWMQYECTKQAFDGASEKWKGAAAAHFHCEGATTVEEATTCRSSPGDRGRDAVKHPEQLRSLTSFVDLSDAQLKEHTIHMEGLLGDELSYDGIQSASSRDDLLEQNDDAVLLAMVLGINAMSTRLPENPALQAGRWAGLPTPRRPSFVIHTGDAVDAGMFSELMQFIGAMDQLNVPYFNTVGNHDNMFFGTIPADLVSGMNVVVPYVPIITTERFMRYHSLEAKKYDPTLPYPEGRDGDMKVRSDLITPTPGSRFGDEFFGSKYHGFDLVCRANSATLPELCPEARGYYSFDLSLGDRPNGAKLRVIVLNTAEVVPQSVGSAFDRRSKANLLPAQLEWLDREIHPSGSTPMFFLVFGHHNLGSFLDDEQADRVKRLLFSEPRVLAYLTAHTHVDDVVEWTRPSGAPFWEIIAGSTLVYPQLGRLVELLVDPDDKQLVLRVTTFRQALGDRAYDLAEGGTAEACDAPKNDCAQIAPRSGFCQHLADRAYFGRAGAARDDDADRRDELDAVSRTNGLMPVYAFRGLDADAEYAKVVALAKPPPSPMAPPTAPSAAPVTPSSAAPAPPTPESDPPPTPSSEAPHADDER